jgi:hypothetical protein
MLHVPNLLTCSGLVSLMVRWLTLCCTGSRMWLSRGRTRACMEPG